MNIKVNFKTLIALGFSLSACFFSSCADDSGIVGLELQNPNEKVYVYNDSLSTIHTYTVQKADSVVLIIGNLPSSMLLGYQIDELLGTFQNNFMTEVNIPSNDVSFGPNPVADSLVLNLNYSYAYGDTNQIQTITVYELNNEGRLWTINGKPMDRNTIGQYYNPTPVTTFSFKPSYSASGSKTVRVTFPDDYKNKFIDSTLYENDSLFRASVLKGYYFEAKSISIGGAISYFNFNESTNLKLYFHNDSTGGTYNYSLNSASYRCNIFYREYNPQIKYLPLQTNPDVGLEQEFFYIKNNNAFEGRIDITGLQTWKDSGYFTFNKAVLYLYIDPPTAAHDSLYPLNSSIEVLKIDEDFARYSLEEYLTSQEYIKVKWDSLPNGYGYRINLNKTLFKTIANGEDVLSLVLNGVSNTVSANRTILKGAKNADQPLKLKITYTKFTGE